MKQILMCVVLFCLAASLSICAAPPDKFFDKNDQGDPALVYAVIAVVDGEVWYRELNGPTAKTNESFIQYWFFLYGNELIVQSIGEPSRPKADHLYTVGMKIIEGARNGAHRLGRIVYADCGNGCIKPIGCSILGTGRGCADLEFPPLLPN